MTPQTPEFPGFGDIPEFDFTDLAQARRIGVVRLLDAAPVAGVARSVIENVCQAAADPRLHFGIRSVPGFMQVVDLAVKLNGREWSKQVLIDRQPRHDLYMAMRAAALRFALGYQRLPADVREAVVDDVLLELSEPKFTLKGSDLKISAWDARPLVYRYVHWRLDTAAKEFDRDRTDANGSTVGSFDRILDLGSIGFTPLQCDESDVADSAVEAAVWIAAHRNLSRQRETKLAGVRAGAARQKVDLTIRAALWVLGEGAADVEVRIDFASDALLTCFRGLGAAAPATWGKYPADTVPTREVLAAKAADAAARRDPEREFFEKTDGRRQELASSKRLLHRIRDLVETMIEEAAHEDF